MLILGAQPGVAWGYAFQLGKAQSPVQENQKREFNPTEKMPQVFPKPSLAFSNSVLIRRQAFFPPPIKNAHYKLDRLSGSLHEELVNPANIFLLSAATLALKSERIGFAWERFSPLASKASGALSYKSPILGAASILAACEPAPDGGNYVQTKDAYVDMETDDGGVSLDNDGDGVPVGLDCDDQNSQKFPLMRELGEVRPNESAVTIRIDQNTEICPGIYNGFTLEVPTGAKEVKLNGNGVILDGRIGGNPVFAQAIRIVNGDGVEVRGFNIQFYNEPISGPGIVRVESSRNVSLIDLSITASGGSWPIRLVDSEACLIEGVLTYTHSDRGIRLERCNDSVVRDSQFSSGSPFDYSSDMYGLLHIEGGHQNSVIESRMFMGQGHGLAVEGALGLQVVDSVMNGSQGSGIFLYGAKDSWFEGNIAAQNMEYGLYVQGNTHGNTFTQNNWNDNGIGAYGERGLQGDAPLRESNEFISNMPQP